MLGADARGQGASRRFGVHQLLLKRSEAVGWIWSLAYFPQAISPESGCQNLPVEHQEHGPAFSAVREHVCFLCVCGGVTEAKVCVFWVDADPGLSCFFTANSRPEGQMMAALCVFWFWGFGFSLFLVSVYGRLGFPRKLTHPGGLACEPCGSDQTHSSGAHTKPASLAML